MAKQVRTIGISIMQLALSVYLIITSICLIFPNLGRSISSAEIEAFLGFAKNTDIIRVLAIVVGVLLLLGGVMLFIKALTAAFNRNNKGVDFGKLDNIIRRVIIVLWIIVTVVALCYYSKTDFKRGVLMLHWILALAKNALIIGGLLIIKDGE
ncbi:MAG: hypothetical protein IJS09_01730 [Treponema sp.]|nr:hypothetical protein [Treponema sp.]